MITIISGTNRRNSATHRFARHYHRLFLETTEETVHLFSLADLPADILHIDMYDPKQQSKGLATIQDDLILPADKFFFLLPEYNGGMPGALKLFIDALSIREYAKTFKGKKAALAGVASGRQGNLRGMDHLTGVLMHMGTKVLPNRLPISSINGLHDEDGTLDAGTEMVMRKQVEEFVAW